MEEYRAKLLLGRKYVGLHHLDLSQKSGSETWNLSPSAMKCIEGFHLKAARRMTGVGHKRGAHGAWDYPLSKDVLEAAGLYTIKTYIDVRHQIIVAFIVNRPIFDLCQRGVRKRGSSPANFGGSKLST